jgi:hypothetical protein
MQSRVQTELRAIPRGSFAQNTLRMIFAIQRQYDLARDPRVAARSSFEAALRSVRQNAPDFVPILGDTTTWS